MGKSVLVGNINIWVHRMDNILQWQQQLDNIQINRVSICPRRTSRHGYGHDSVSNASCPPAACSHRHGADRPACQSAAEHHAAADGRQGPGQPGPGVSGAGGPDGGPPAVEETLPVSLHRQTGTKTTREGEHLTGIGMEDGF